MPIPTENVGSLPRPKVLQDTFAAYDEGRVSREKLVQEQDRAAKDSIERMAATGQAYVTDGEQRASSFATYSITDTLGGTGLMENMKADGQYFAIFDDGHHRQLPRLVSGPFRYKTYAYENLKLSLPYAEAANAKMKQAVIAPSMMYLTYPLTGEIEGYPRSEFLKDLVDECEKDIRGCFAAGAVRVSIDFTEGRLATKNDPRNPWTGAELLDSFISLINKVLAHFTPEERQNIGLHTCPGGDCDSVHSAELASEKNKEAVYKEIGQRIRKDADGVKQVAFIGVVNTLSARLETPEEICEDLITASKYIARDQLGATDDCGFSPFSIDVKPSHGGDPDFARDVAFQKIANRVKGAALASEKLGI